MLLFHLATSQVGSSGKLGSILLDALRFHVAGHAATHSVPASCLSLVAVFPPRIAVVCCVAGIQTSRNDFILLLNFWLNADKSLSFRMKDLITLKTERRGT